MRKSNFLLALLLFAAISVFAQTRRLTGKVTDSKSKAPLASVTVQVKGTKIRSLTGDGGSFSLTVPDGAIELECSYVGYTTKSVTVQPGESDIDITMEEGLNTAGEVVVTALGIQKDARKVGYSVTKVDGGLLNQARETNVAYSLEGRVAGLSVRGTSGGPGSSARILLRGLPSISSSGNGNAGAGSPLFVINGIPMDNTQRGSTNEWGGADNGDGISNINPDDIESMTVLKGQSASALYGARAAYGVILITTKSGKKGNFSVDYNANYVVDKPVDFTDFQYEYGQGTYGAKPANAAAAQGTTRLAWGAKMDGAPTIQFDGKQYAYSPFKSNLTDFYRTAPSFTNTVSMSKGGDGGSFRLSLSDLDNKSIVRNSTLKRYTINLTMDQKITDKLTVNVLANYIDEMAHNKPYLSDGPLNPNNGFFLAGNINQSIFAPGYKANGDEVLFTDDNFATNPWFAVNQAVNDVARKRLISAVSAKYTLTDWLYAQGRVGYDLQNDHYFQVTPTGTDYSRSTINGQVYTGGLGNLSSPQTSQLNAEFLLGVNKSITKDLKLDAVLGANLLKSQFERIGISGGPFLIPYLYSYNNVVNFGRSYEFFKKEAHSAYYTIDLTYKGFLTLNTTGRYDVFSTLPSSARNIFTPSVSGSFVFSELTHLPVLSFGKLRASYAQTSGEPTQAYQTSTYYGLFNTQNGIPTGAVSSSLPNLFLKPFTIAELELGTELRFFKNRLGIDLTYFNRKTRKEILSGNLSSSSGYTNYLVPSGSIQNKGIELLLTGSPVQGKDFNWNVSLNMTNIKNKTLSTDLNGNNLNLGTYRPLNANTAIVKGLSGPQIMAYDYKRDASGNMIVDQFGSPVRGSLKPMGSVLPTWYGGLNNEFSYKGFNLAFLIDYNYGNKLLSATNYYTVFRGLNKLTLEGRATGVTTGVLENGQKNTTTATAQDYYQNLARNVSAINVLNGDFIKLRQLTLGYTLSEKTLGKLPLFSSIQLSFVARNLLVLMKHTDNIDPEAGFSSTVRYAGIEGTSLPSTRSFGFNANFKFKK